LPSFNKRGHITEQEQKERDTIANKIYHKLEDRVKLDEITNKVNEKKVEGSGDDFHERFKAKVEAHKAKIDSVGKEETSSEKFDKFLDNKEKEKEEDSKKENDFWNKKSEPKKDTFHTLNWLETGNIYEVQGKKMVLTHYDSKGALFNEVDGKGQLKASSLAMKQNFPDGLKFLGKPEKKEYPTHINTFADFVYKQTKNENISISYNEKDDMVRVTSSHGNGIARAANWGAKHKFTKENLDELKDKLKELGYVVQIRR